MAEVLYRKYRPKTFADVAGQTHIRVTLERQLEMDKVGHAYLFCGPRGVAKTTLARILAKAVNCISRPKGASEPCNTCTSCMDIMNSRSLDVLEIDAASHTGVDNVRQNIIDNTRFVPSHSKHKVFIIDEVHMLSVAAFNALLKILEEPPSYVIFVLVTTEVHKIPDTIISRCQRFDFLKIHHNDAFTSLSHIISAEGREAENAVLERITRASDGCLRDALSLLDQVLSLGDKKISLSQVELILPASNNGLLIELTEHLVRRNTDAAIRFIGTLLNEGVELVHFTADSIEFFRKLLVAKVTGSLDEFLLEQSDVDVAKIQFFLSRLSVEDILFSLRVLMEEKSAFKTSPIPQLPLEMAVVEICERLRLNSVTTLADLEPKGTLRETLEGGKKGETNQSDRVASDEQTAPLQVPPLSESVGEAVPKAHLEVLEVAKEVQEEKHRREEIPTLTLEKVQSRWNDVVETVAFVSQSLSLLLRVGRPIECTEKGIIVGFQFKLHRERVNEMKNKNVVCSALQKVFQAPLDFECIVSDKAKIDLLPIEEMVTAEIGGDGGTASENHPAVASILREFGGTLVN
jgi:DNA polymerase-3 subunit gamma/tau